MKTLITIMTVFLCASAQAEIYKCFKNDTISYQQLPCNESKSIGYEFRIQNDLSAQQLAYAKEQMDMELADYNDAKKLKKEANDKERIIRAEERKAEAAFKSVEQKERQTIALESRNKREIYDQSSVYFRNYYPYGGYPYRGKAYGWDYHRKKSYGKDHHRRKPHLRSPSRYSKNISMN